MASVLKLEEHDEDRELAFELDYLLSLSTEDRFRMMRERSDEMKRTLLRLGHRKPVEVVQRQ